MGQAMPLPERIPRPCEKELEILKALGFNIGEGEDYVPLVLPQGYRWVDNSPREDLPDWYIVNDENLAVVEVYGNWKGTFWDRLQLHVHEEPMAVEFVN